MNEDGPTDSAWHRLSVQDTLARLGSNPIRGLSNAEATDRIEVHGPNRLREPERWIRMRRFIDQFRDVLIWLLIIAAVASGVLLQAWIDAAAIGAIVVLNALVGYVQETKARTSLDRLRDLGALEATVVRDGTVRRIPAEILVPGDVILVEAGDRVPADARILDSIRLVVDEAALTGESVPVARSTEPAVVDAAIGDRSSMIHAGTTVVSGRARAVVTATGMTTEIGHIAELFGDEQPRTPLQIELARIGRRLAMVASLAAVLIFWAGTARDFPIESMILTAVALAVAAIPEGLPAVITVSLAGGMQRMAHRNAIVRRLPAVEALGAVDVICTDKTGTLTAPDLEVGEVVMADGREGLSLLTRDDPGVGWLRAVAVLVNNAYRTEQGWQGDPTEVALLRSLASPDLVSQLVKELPRRDEAAFDARRKRMSTVHWDGSRYVLLVKGAPEVLLERSARLLADGGYQHIADQGSHRIREVAERLAAGGMRPLAFAMRELDELPDDPADEEYELTFIATIGLREKVRAEVPDALARAARAGVRTVMVTGDHATTATAIADAVGLDRGEVIAGAELARMTVDELTDSVEQIRVYARVDPADKVKIIEAWQRRGATVAMTGDGVNDAPALHRADIGVAMGSGTDIARESAAMVLTDDNYATIVAAIAEGRRLFANLRNVVHYLLSANASEVIYVMLGFLVFGSLGEPLLAVQLLWVNLVSDSLPAIALGMDRPTRDLMSDPPGCGRDVLSARNTILLLIQGALLASAAVVTMSIGAFALGHNQATVQTMVFTTLVLSQLLHAVNVRAAAATRHGAVISLPKLMWTALIGSTALHLAVVYTETGNTLFRTTPLGFVEMVCTVGAALFSMVLVRISNRPHPDGPTSPPPHDSPPRSSRVPGHGRHRGDGRFQARRLWRRDRRADRARRPVRGDSRTGLRHLAPGADH